MHTIAIVGAGFSGTMTAVHLLRSMKETPTTIVLLERTGQFAAGVAYGTASSSHVLNVPAGRMSAFPDDSGHFLRWAQRREEWIGGGSFVPRMMYRQYLADVLDEAEAAAPRCVRAMRISGDARLLRPQDGSGAAGEAADASAAPVGAAIELAGGGRITADHVVLAIGNFPPADPPVANVAFYASSRYVRDAWSPSALALDPDDAVLLLGSGLTMLDIALALRDRGHRGAVTALSRRGLLPQPHRESSSPPLHHESPVDLDRWPPTARGMLRSLRAEVRAAALRGVDWREVVTSIRHDTSALWRRLDEHERRRFLRHLRPYWETHRHRSAPATDRSIRGLIASRRLQVLAGRLVAVHEFDGGLELAIQPRGETRHERLHVARVINCTGPNTDLAGVKDPLIQNLRRLGLIRPDALGLGLDSDDAGAVLDADGRPSAWLSVVGPLRKGDLWEHTAVPELRVEAQAMARRLAGEDSPQRATEGHGAEQRSHR